MRYGRWSFRLAFEVLSWFFLVFALTVGWGELHRLKTFKNHVAPYTLY